MAAPLTSRALRMKECHWDVVNRLQPGKRLTVKLVGVVVLPHPLFATESKSPATGVSRGLILRVRELSGT